MSVVIRKTPIYNLDCSNSTYTIEIDLASGRGYFERNSDGDGGGLWFNPIEGVPGPHLTPPDLALADYDGMACLPRAVATSLRQAGFYVDPTFD